MIYKCFMIYDFLEFYLKNIKNWFLLIDIFGVFIGV